MTAKKPKNQPQTRLPRSALIVGGLLIPLILVLSGFFPEVFRVELAGGLNLSMGVAMTVGGLSIATDVLRYTAKLLGAKKDLSHAFKATVFLAAGILAISLIFWAANLRGKLYYLSAVLLAGLVVVQKTYKMEWQKSIAFLAISGLLFALYFSLVFVILKP